MPCEVSIESNCLRFTHGSKWTRFAWTVIRVVNIDEQGLLLEVGWRRAVLSIPIIAFSSPHDLQLFAAEIKRRTAHADAGMFSHEPHAAPCLAAVNVRGQPPTDRKLFCCLLLLAAVCYWAALAIHSSLGKVAGIAGFLFSMVTFLLLRRLLESRAVDAEVIEATAVGLFAASDTQQSFLPYDELIEVHATTHWLLLEAACGFSHSIPRSAFANPADCDIFLQALPQNIDAVGGTSA